MSHEKRFIEYLRKKYPHSWGRKYADPKMHTIANFAMDWDLCNEAYDDEDKEIVRSLTLNGEFIGGLVTEDNVHDDTTAIWFKDGTKEVFNGSQFNNWQNKTMEDMWQMLHDAHNVYTHKDPADFGEKGIPQDSAEYPMEPGHDEEYKAMFDKIIQKFGHGKASVAELYELAGRLAARDDVDLDNWKFDYSEQLNRKVNR